MPHPRDEMMIWTWAGWEPLQYYRRVGGFHEQQEGNALWADDWQATLHSERAAKALAEAGVNWVTTHFYKGFGLEAEAEEIDATRRMIENYHKHGVRVFTYIQYGTIVTQTLLDEQPDAERWGRVDWRGHHDGGIYEYGDQYWRRKPCARQPGVREYFLDIVDKACAIGADGIWVDNLNADGCHCDACQDAFRAYVKEHVADPWRELGLRNPDRVFIPRAEKPRDPVFQLWVRFRCEEVRTSIRLMAERARRNNPEILVGANIGLGSHQRSTVDNGDWIGFLDCLDVNYAENGLLPRLLDGRMYTQHFAMKVASAADQKIVPGSSYPGERVGPYRKRGIPDAATIRRVFAESLLFGAHPAGGPWGMRGENGGADPAWIADALLRENTLACTEVYAKWHDLVRQSADAAPAGLFYSFEDQSFDDGVSKRLAEVTMPQLLHRHQIPFRYVLSDRLEGLEGLDLLLLPHVLCLSDEQAEAIRAWVKGGGTLFATGRTSMYDPWYRQRRDYALADVFGHHFSDAFEADHQEALLVNPANGCLLLPGEWGMTDPDGKPYISVPDDRIAQALRRALPSSRLPEVLAPRQEIILDLRRLPDGRLLAGLINYADSPARDVTLLFHAGAAPEGIECFSMDGTHTSLACHAAPDGRYAVSHALETDLFLLLPGA